MKKNQNKSIFEKLVEINPDTEIPWDSSPLIYPLWRGELLGSAKHSNEREKAKERLLRLYNPDHAEDALFRGVTTNPPLSLSVLSYQKEYWRN